MNTPLEREIRKRLEDYLIGEMTLNDFASWFWPATFDVSSSDGEPLVSLAGVIQLRLSEFEAGHWDEAALHDQLRLILDASVQHAMH